MFGFWAHKDGFLKTFPFSHNAVEIVFKKITHPSVMIVASFRPI